MKKQGFTLIELLIVIAIIGVLAAVLIPNLLRARAVAQDRAAQAFAQNVYTAANAFLAESTANIVAAGTCNGFTGAVGARHVWYGGTAAAPAYRVADPGAFVTGCTITAGATRVTVTYTGGTGTTATVGLP